MDASVRTGVALTLAMDRKGRRHVAVVLVGDGCFEQS